MKSLLWIVGLLLLLSACGQGEQEQKGNLILTNYSSTAIANISVSHCGEELALSEAGTMDTQLCAFVLPEEADYTYTVSFETADGQTVSETFTDSFAGGNTVYLRADREGNAWHLGLDSAGSP